MWFLLIQYMQPVINSEHELEAAKFKIANRGAPEVLFKYDTNYRENVFGNNCLVRKCFWK